MIAVKFVYDDVVLKSQVHKTIQLRHLQKDLCVFFKQPFPKKNARLKVYDKIYEDFMDYPFEDAVGEEIVATVFFQDTTNPYFYDLFDRKSFKYSLEQEIEWELDFLVALLARLSKTG